MSAITDWLMSIASLSLAAIADDRLYDFYAKNLRGSLFSGFLTLSGFLFSVNTFIVVNMKKELFDHEDYLKRVLDQRAINATLTVYGPLRRLSKLLLLAVASSVTASMVQFTIGLLHTRFTVVIGLLAPAVAIFFLVKVLWIIRKNLNDLFSFQEEVAEKKLKAMRESAKKSVATQSTVGDAPPNPAPSKA